MSHRRSLVALSALAVPALLLAGCSGSPERDDDTIVVSTFPFGVEAMEEAVFDPFTEATGIEVEIETGSNSDRLSQLQVGGTDADVVLISDFYAALGQEDDLFQPVDESLVPNLAEVASFALDDAYQGPAYSYQLNGTLYSTADLDEAEAADWELYASNPGRVALPDISVTAGQLMVSGVAETYGDGPYDVDTAFETLADWAPDVLQFYTSSTEVTNLLSQGEIVAADSLNGFATDLIASGEDVAWTAPAEGRFMATNRAMISAEAQNTDGANAFIDYLLSAEAQSAAADLVGDLPVTPAAEIPDELRAVVGDLADDPEAGGYRTLDPAELVSTRSEWVDRFAREVTSR